MATQALIKINGTNAPDATHLDLPIDTLVQLGNAGLGGESTYAWEILDQPPGTTDALSATNIASPTFTPKKEGTYLLQLTVNAGLASEKVATAAAAVLQVKTGERVPAAGETTEAGTSKGWAAAVAALLRRVDALQADAGTIVGAAGSNGLVRGDILRVTGITTIKSGLPGEEKVPTFTLALASNYQHMDETLFVLEGGVNGADEGVSGNLITVRARGVFGPITIAAGGVPAAGTPVHATDAGFFISPSPETVARLVGLIVAASDLGGGNISATLFFDGSIQSPHQALTILDLHDLGALPSASKADQVRIAIKDGVPYISVDTGAYAKMLPQRGVGILVGGTVTISGVVLTANSTIQYSRANSGGTLGHLSCPTASRNVGAGTFVISSDNALDTSGIEWTIWD